MGAEMSGAGATDFVPAEVLLAASAVECGYVDATPNKSCNRSSRSDSSRPFDSSTSYPERAESLYQAVIFVVTRTTDPPEGTGVMRTSH